MIETYDQSSLDPDGNTNQTPETKETEGRFRLSLNQVLYRTWVNKFDILEMIPCVATAKGGNIDVLCVSPDGGLLTVMENNYSGWKVSINDQPAKLLQEDWLSIEIPPGKQSVSFRYRPLDVMIGVVLTVLGIVMSVWMSIRKPVEVDSISS